MSVRSIQRCGLLRVVVAATIWPGGGSRHAADYPLVVAKGLLMIPAGRQCSFWSSDGALGNRPVPPPALPISPDIVPQRAGVTTVWFGSFDSLANQPNGPPVSGNAVFTALKVPGTATQTPWRPHNGIEMNKTFKYSIQSVSNPPFPPLASKSFHNSHRASIRPFPVSDAD
jgi:hypothetical protein